MNLFIGKPHKLKYHQNQKFASFPAPDHKETSQAQISKPETRLIPGHGHREPLNTPCKHIFCRHIQNHLPLYSISKLLVM